MDKTGGRYSPTKADEMIQMSDSEKLRVCATRLFAMVLNAREQGLGCADNLADLANEALAQADKMDRRGGANEVA